MSRGGQNEIYTPELAKAICDNLELGMPIGLAAEAEGLSRNTAYTWIDRDHHGFAKAVTRAKAIGARVLVQKSLDGGKGSAAAQFHLERRYSEDYGPPRKADEGSQPSEVRIVIEGGLRETSSQP